MSTRAEDHDPAVMRVVPNWAAVSALATLLMLSGGCIWQAATAVAALEASTEAQKQLATVVEHLREEVARSRLGMAVHDSELAHIKERVTDLEYRATALERRRK